MKTIEDNFRELKEKHPDAVILFRTGDWYESVFEDAKVVADVCGIVQTKQRGIVKATFPYTALDSYLPKLIRAGHRIAICDQIGPVKTIKKRGITETV